MTDSIDLKKIDANPQKLKEVSNELSFELKLSISYGQLKRFIKEKLHYSWHNPLNLSNNLTLYTQ